MEHAAKIAEAIHVEKWQVENTMQLLEDGNTIPYIVHYRKEATGGLGERRIRKVEELARDLKRIEDRRAGILKRVESLGGMTPEFAEKVKAAKTKIDLEDLYLPFRNKNKSRAVTAIKRGLEPLADLIWAQGVVEGTQDVIAGPYVSEGIGVPDVNAAWAGARDIVAERITDMQQVRHWLRGFMLDTGILQSRVENGKESDGPRYRDYFNYEEPAKSVVPHKLLTIRRGEKEGILTYQIFIEREKALKKIRELLLLEGGGDLGEHFHVAIEDAYDRLLLAAIRKEVKRILREKADRSVLDGFGKTLKRLLLAPALGEERVLGVVTNVREGCRLVALDEAGNLLENMTVHFSGPKRDVKQASDVLTDLLERHQIKAIAVGGGMGGKETEEQILKLREDDRLGGAKVLHISQTGASAYATSALGEKEWPDLDPASRESATVARRAQTQLVEFLKVEPGAISVGQHKYDIDAAKVEKEIVQKAQACVNATGVDLLKADTVLLSYVAGMDKELAARVVKYREANDGFSNLEQLKNIPEVDENIFRQAAGFLRITGGDNPLDATSIHPDQYELVNKIAASVDTDVPGLFNSSEARAKVDAKQFVNDAVGEPTLQHILAELASPGMSMRSAMEPVQFDPSVSQVKHLEAGQVLEGIVSNLAEFGAFVNIGVHQDGLVHVSELSHEFVKDPASVVHPGKRVKVKVLEVDKDRKRISLSIKAALPAPERPKRPEPERRQSRPTQDRPQRNGKPGGRPQGGRGKGPRRGGRSEQKREYGPGGSSKPNPDNPFAALQVTKEGIQWKEGKDPKQKKK